jgi:hypothetical protein
MLNGSVKKAPPPKPNSQKGDIMKYLLAIVLSCLALSACNQKPLEQTQPMFHDEIGDYFVLTTLEITDGVHPHAAAEVRAYPSMKRMRMMETVRHDDALFTLTFGETLPVNVKSSDLVDLDYAACLVLEHDGAQYLSCKEGELSAQHSFNYTRTTGLITSGKDCLSPTCSCYRYGYRQPVYWSEYQPNSSSNYHSHTKVSGQYTRTWYSSYQGVYQVLGLPACKTKTNVAS